MNLKTDVLIVGAGLAGAAAALHLSSSRDVIVADQGSIASGASLAAAGLANPLLGRRAQPVWNMEDAFEALESTVTMAASEDIFLRNGVLRPALNHEQAIRFCRAADRYNSFVEWIEPHDVERRYPCVHATHGSLLVQKAGAINIPEFCHRMLAGVSVRTGWRLTGFEETSSRVTARFATDEGPATAHASTVVFAHGAGFCDLPATASLSLHRIKGQTVGVHLDDPLPPDHPHVAGLGYIVIEPLGSAGSKESSGSRRLVLGSTYDHQFESTDPTPEATSEIIAKTAGILPRVRHSTVVDVRAGIRVTVPQIRLPMIGPLPGHKRTWIFSGLGTKGLLMAPLLGQNLPAWLKAPHTIPEELTPRIRE